MPEMNDVERVYNELRAVRALLTERGEPSDLVAFEQLSAKTLLLCAASFFERYISASLLETAGATGTSPIFRTFIEKQALERKYHSMFDWDRSNTNKFFALFGPDIRDWMKGIIDADDALAASVREFIFLNSERNKLVHGNFAAISTDVTVEEVWQKFTAAEKFSEWLVGKLKEAAEAGGVPA